MKLKRFSNQNTESLPYEIATLSIFRRSRLTYCSNVIVRMRIVDSLDALMLDGNLRPIVLRCRILYLELCAIYTNGLVGRLFLLYIYLCLEIMPYYKVIFKSFRILLLYVHTLSISFYSFHLMYAKNTQATRCTAHRTTKHVLRVLNIWAIQMVLIEFTDVS